MSINKVCVWRLVSWRKGSFLFILLQLTYTPRSSKDYGQLTCEASNSVGKQRKPCFYTIFLAGESVYLYVLRIYLLRIYVYSMPSSSLVSSSIYAYVYSIIFWSSPPELTSINNAILGSVDAQIISSISGLPLSK